MLYYLVIYIYLFVLFVGAKIRHLFHSAKLFISGQWLVVSGNLYFAIILQDNSPSAGGQR